MEMRVGIVNVRGMIVGNNPNKMTKLRNLRPTSNNTNCKSVRHIPLPSVFAIVIAFIVFMVSRPYRYHYCSLSLRHLSEVLQC